MESETFRSRLIQLLQKSRRALRLYTSAGQQQSIGDERLQSELSSAQVEEWRQANSDLLRKLSEAAEAPHVRNSVCSVLALRNEFQEQWRAAESELAQDQQELELCAKQGDFIRAAVLSAKLVRLKARVQASQAAHHELTNLLRKTKIGSGDLSVEEADAQQTIELLDENVVEEADQPDFAPQRVASGGGAGGKILQMRRRLS